MDVAFIRDKFGQERKPKKNGPKDHFRAFVALIDQFAREGKCAHLVDIIRGVDPALRDAFEDRRQRQNERSRMMRRKKRPLFNFDSITNSLAITNSEDSDSYDSTGTKRIGKWKLIMEDPNRFGGNGTSEWVKNLYPDTDTSKWEPTKSYSAERTRTSLKDCAKENRVTSAFVQSKEEHSFVHATIDDPTGPKWVAVNGYRSVLVNYKALHENIPGFSEKEPKHMDDHVWTTYCVQNAIKHILKKVEGTDLENQFPLTFFLLIISPENPAYHDLHSWIWHDGKIAKGHDTSAITRNVVVPDGCIQVTIQSRDDLNPDMKPIKLDFSNWNPKPEKIVLRHHDKEYLVPHYQVVSYGDDGDDSDSLEAVHPEVTPSLCGRPTKKRRVNDGQEIKVTFVFGD